MREITGFQCEDCGQIYESEDEALECEKDCEKYWKQYFKRVKIKGSD